MESNTDIQLILELINKPETEIIEYKVGNFDQDRIAKYISALSNSAAVKQQKNAFMIWGVNDDTKSLEGSKFYPYSLKKGNENFVAWLEHVITPKIDFVFKDIEFENKHFVLLTIPAARLKPVSFKNNRFIRSGSSLKPLSEFPNKEKALWDSFSDTSFEKQLALQNISFEQIVQLLSIETYFKEMNIPIPGSNDQVAEFLSASEIISPEKNGLYSITNLGALTLARNMNHFPKLKRHSLRVIKYNGENKLDAESDYTGMKGYAVGFQGLLNYVSDKVPKYELYTDGSNLAGGKRQVASDYPNIALRELIANALIHQDFTISGVSPTVEIYSNRVVITNPGRPLIDINRLLDYPPRSRNDELATLFRRMKFIEERGSGIDKTVHSLEIQELPAPRMVENGDFFQVTLFSKRQFNQLTIEDKMRATYLHASLKRMEEGYLTNASLRKRFGLKTTDSPKISKLITSTLEAGWIEKFDINASPKQMKYVPFWAK